MASLAARTAHTIPRSRSSAVDGMWRRVGGWLSSNESQFRTFSDEGLDRCVPRSPEASRAADPLVDIPLSREPPPVVPKILTLGRLDGFRVYRIPRRSCRATVFGNVGQLPIEILRAQVIGRGPVGNFLLPSSTVATESCQDSLSQDFVGGKDLKIGSASGGSSNILIRDAVAFLKRRQQQGTIIDSYTFVEILKRCSNQRDFVGARQVHDCATRSGMDTTPYVANSLMNAYVRFGRLEDARRVFDGLEKKTKSTWGIMIGGYAKNGHPGDALEVFNRMRQGGEQPGGFLCLSILNACATPEALKWGQEVHAHVRQAGLESDVGVGIALVQMYAKCGSIKEAREVFESLTNRSVITWNVMIGSYARSGCGWEAYGLFLRMEREGFNPNAVTYLSILKAPASAKPGAWEWVRKVHSHALETGLLETDLRVANALLHMYAKCGSIPDARLVFDSLKTRDLTTWNIMIGAYAERNLGVEAHRLFLQMEQDGLHPDAITYVNILNASGKAKGLALDWVKEVHSHALESGLLNSDLRVGGALIHMYAKSGQTGDARLVFDSLITRNVIIWNIMIGAYADRGDGREAYRLFLQMKREGFKPDAFTFANLLNSASASAGALEWVQEVHGHACTAGLEADLLVGNALVHMYAKSGSIDDARRVFERMGRRDVVTWSSMMGGLAHHGCGHETLELFRGMNEQGVQPNEASFVAALIACCHAGLLEEGQRLFRAMTEEYGVKPTVLHYTCMVDLLGRAGQLEEAKNIIENMPMEPDGVIWQALLGACRTHGAVGLGELAAEEVLKLEPQNASAYVLLSNIYAAAGQWEKVSSVRSMMQERGVRKEPGRSWIGVDGKVHEFVVGDTSHPEATAIYVELSELTQKLKAAGYMPDFQRVLQKVDEEFWEVNPCSHSERLAIAYGLIRAPSGKAIRVFKNLRVCPDCHTASKLISKVTGREIIARDVSRFHHFKDGVCSCGDYW